jgi:hypothetical protein
VEAADDHRLRWRLNNLEFDQHEVRSLAEAWVSGAPPIPDLRLDATVTPRAVILRINARLQLRFRQMLEPEGFSNVSQADGTDADIALLQGDHEAAVRCYLGHIARDPGNTEHWAGLALARRRIGDDDIARVLATRPELVRATCQAALDIDGILPDVEKLADWLALCLAGSLAGRSA